MLGVCQLVSIVGFGLVVWDTKDTLEVAILFIRGSGKLQNWWFGDPRPLLYTSKPLKFTWLPVIRYHPGVPGFSRACCCCWATNTLERDLVMKNWPSSWKSYQIREDLPFPRHPLILSEIDWGVQSPPQQSVDVPLPLSKDD